MVVAITASAPASIKVWAAPTSRSVGLRVSLYSPWWSDTITMSATSLRALTTSVMTSKRAGEIPGLSASANHG